MEVVFDIISGKEQLNAFMHAADVFEAGKILGEYEQIKVNITMEEGRTLDYALLQTKMKEAYESEKYIITFMAIRTIDGKINVSVDPYIKPMVQTISSGNQWMLFSKLLERLEYNVETDDRMHVTYASFKVKPEKLRKFIKEQL